MPRLISPKSLQTICTDSIVDNLEALWLPRFISEVFPNSNNSRTVRPLYIIGPFDCLDCKSSLSLFNRALHKGKTSSQVILLLLNYKVLEVDLSRARHLTSVRVWETLNSRCLHIHKLNLSTCARITSADLVQIIHQFGRDIKDLDLSLTRCDDSVTQAIGEHCKILEKLNLDGCDRLTNGGFVNLFRDKDGMCTSLCSTLQDLDIHSFNTEQPNQLIGSLLKFWCPNLQYLSYSFLFPVLIAICDSSSSSAFQLKRIPPVCTDEYHPSQLYNVMQSLPNISQLIMAVGVRENIFWEVLNNWSSRLESLHVKAPFPLTWLPGVVMTVPHIRHLTLSMSSISTHLQDFIGVHSFKLVKLETLHATFISHRIVPNNVFMRCLDYIQKIVKGSFSTLREVTVNSFPHFGINGFVFWCCQNNAFTSVELLNLEDCAVESCAVWDVIRQTNAVKKLVLNKCQNISLAQVQNMRKYIKENNLEFEIEYDL